MLESLDHLRPWMAWAALEPVPLAQRRLQISDWERTWRAGGDANLGVFLNDELIGACGMHGRIGSGGLEIGYWIHPAFARRGLATRVAGLLTEAALAHPGISYVEIHHDKANEASGRIPRRLGYTLVEERDDERSAPAEVGVECRWRKERPRAQRSSTVGSRL